MTQRPRKILLLIILMLMACRFSVPPPALAPAVTVSPEPNFSIITHPDGALYVGDLVSFEVFSPTGVSVSGQMVRVSIGDKSLGETSFQPFGLGARSQATFYWAWDTHGLEAGTYTLTFSLPVGNTRWDEKITLLPASAIPLPEPDARWESVDTPCCVIHYVSGTDAEADIETLKRMVVTQVVDVEARLGTKFDKKIPVTFLPRVLGHGGFTSDGIYVSYLRQNYAGSTAQQVTHHEMVHWLDAQIGGDQRPSILQEGLAVYMSDGHFKVEPILPRAAALLDIGSFVPLRQLSDSFYTSQHEIGYVEAAALVSYLITTYGRDEFNSFYRDIHSAPGNSQADMLDSALQAHFDISLAQLEQNFIAFLHQQKIDETDRADLRLTLAFYDTVRRYQRVLDPSAYFLTAWLPNAPEMRSRGIVADFVRHPHAAINQELERLLTSSDANLRAGNYIAAEAGIRAVNLTLNVLEKWQK